MALITETPDDIPSAQTQPLIAAAKVKIVGGMSEYALENPPAVGESRTYIVKGVCKKHHMDKVDGEDRLVVDIEQTSIYERGKVPIVDEQQPALFGESEAEKEAKTAEAEVAAESETEGDGTEAEDTEPIDPPEAEEQGTPAIFSDTQV